MKKYNIEELVSRISLEDVLDRYGWETKRRGRYIMVLCKFHKDTKFGSAMIYPDNPDYFFCFTCGQRYNIFDVYMYEHNCEFAEALEGLAQEYGIAPQEDGKKVKRMPFSRKELAEIGLCMYDRKDEAYVKGYVADGEDPKELKAKGFRIYTETFCENPFAINPVEEEYSFKAERGLSQMEHLNMLFRDERNIFKELVRQKAVEADDRHTKNYLFFQAISNVLDEKGARSYLTDELMFQALHGMYTARKIIAELKRL